MARIKPASEIAAKWARVAPQRQQDFEAGVRDPGVEWARPTAAARESWEAGIGDAVQRGAFSKGVEASGTELWRRKVVDVGTARWGPGVRAAQTDFENGFAPFQQVIERTPLPPRGMRGDPRNIERSAVLAAALSAARRR